MSETRQGRCPPNEYGGRSCVEWKHAQELRYALARVKGLAAGMEALEDGEIIKDELGYIKATARDALNAYDVALSDREPAATEGDEELVQAKCDEVEAIVVSALADQHYFANSPRTRAEPDSEKITAAICEVFDRDKTRLRDLWGSLRPEGDEERSAEDRDGREKLARSIHSRCLLWTRDGPPCESCYADADRYIEWIRIDYAPADSPSADIKELAPGVPWVCMYCGKIGPIGGECPDSLDGVHAVSLKDFRSPSVESGQHEPDFPGHETVRVSMADPHMVSHQASDSCSEEAPHHDSKCGYFGPSVEELRGALWPGFPIETMTEAWAVIKTARNALQPSEKNK
jgi:hypothetical protein